MKYLIEIHHGLGDVVQITGVIETIYNGDSRADIGLILYDELRADLFEEDPRVNIIYFLNIKKRNKIVETLKKIRDYRYDYVFFSPISNEIGIQLLAIFLGAKAYYGEQLILLSKISSKYHLINKKDEHIVIRNSRILEATGMFSPISDPKIEGLPKLPDVEGIGNKIIGLCIGTSKPSKTWFIDRYLEVAEYFEKQGYEIVFIGGKNEEKIFPIEVLNIHGAWHNFIGKLNIMESAALTRKCCLVLGGDTGIMHIAAAVNTPTVALFSCSDPRLHAPYSDKSYILTAGVECQYCYETSGYVDCLEYKCLKGITVEKVIEVMQGVLEDSPFVEQFRFKRKSLIKD